MKNSQTASNKSSAAVTRPRGRRKQPKELREAKEALYREHIMDVAERMFAELGFAETKMQDVAREAGISLGTLYQAYPGKEDLYRGVLIDRDAKMFEEVLVKGEKSISAPQSVEQLLWLTGINLSFLLNNPDYLRMQLQAGYAWYHSAAQVSSDEKQMWERGLAMMEQVFAWGIKEGLFIPGNTGDMARLLMSLQQTRLANWVTSGMSEAHDVVVTRIQADFVRNFCCPGVAGKLMSEDGATLNAKTLAVIASM